MAEGEVLLLFANYISSFFESQLGGNRGCRFRHPLIQANNIPTGRQKALWANLCLG